jgi:predicted nucleotidyltransferase component of viral defense system
MGKFYINFFYLKLLKNLIKNGKLNLYSKERMFITKLVTFISRKEFKDIYDIAHLVDKIDIKQFIGKENVIKLIQDTIQTILQEDLNKMFKMAFRNVDLKFKKLKESRVETFIKETVNKLRIIVNKLKKLNS